MKDRIVVDVEIQKTIGEDGLTWDDTDKLGVSCAAAYEYRTDRFRVYGPSVEDLARLRDRIEAADEVIGFNVLRFDLPVIFHASKAEWSKQITPGEGLTLAEGELVSGQREDLWRPKTNDLLLRIWWALGLDDATFSEAHKGWGLDAVCRGTLGRGKIGHGAKAPKWFRAGQWWRVANYCLDDVALERDLADFMDRFGYVVGPSGVRLDVPSVRP